MMNDQEISSDKLSSKVNALIIIDIQEKIIRPIFNKDTIIKNITKLINAYQILEENIFICLLYTSPSPRDDATSRMPSSA